MESAGTPVVYASESIVLAAMEIVVHHGGIPVDYIAIKVEIGTLNVPDGWPDLVPESLRRCGARAGAKGCQQTVLRVPSATMSLAEYNYVLNPSYPDFARIAFRFDVALRDQVVRRAS